MTGLELQAGHQDHHHHQGTTIQVATHKSLNMAWRQAVNFSEIRTLFSPSESHHSKQASSSIIVSSCCCSLLIWFTVLGQQSVQSSPRATLKRHGLASWTFQGLMTGSLVARRRLRRYAWKFSRVTLIGVCWAWGRTSYYVGVAELPCLEQKREGISARIDTARAVYRVCVMRSEQCDHRRIITLIY